MNEAGVPIGFDRGSKLAILKRKQWREAELDFRQDSLICVTGDSIQSALGDLDAEVYRYSEKGHQGKSLVQTAREMQNNAYLLLGRLA